VVVIVVESPVATTPLELAFDPDEPIRIGRDPQNQVQLPDASVSLSHAHIRSSSSGHVLVDEHSTNGTFLNTTRLVPAVASPLTDGDRIQIGRARLVVKFRPAGGSKGGFSTQDIALAMVHGALISAGSRVAPRLSVVAGPDRGLELVLREERSYVLGRDPDVDLKLSDEDASRRHTRVIRRGSRLWVVDLGSRNGTRLDGRLSRPNVAELWTDNVLLELGRNQLAIDDPVSSALRDVERASDEKLGTEWGAFAKGADAFGPTEKLAAAPDLRPPRSGESRGGFATVAEPKALLSLSTSSSSSAPSAPIEVLRFRESEPPKKVVPRGSRWSALDALVIGVAVVTIALSALALAWFLAS
jgi:pSer/pThr/pTyr-binding forkhead associated (FHA) protein